MGGRRRARRPGLAPVGRIIGDRQHHHDGDVVLPAPANAASTTAFGHGLGIVAFGQHSGQTFVADHTAQPVGAEQHPVARRESRGR